MNPDEKKRILFPALAKHGEKFFLFTIRKIYRWNNSRVEPIPNLTSSNSVLTFIGRFSFPNYVRSDDTKHFDIPMDPTAVFGCALPAEISNILATLQLQTNILRSSYTNILKFPAIADCFKGTNFSRLS